MVSWCDLDAVVQSWVRKGGISDAVEYEAFRRVWDPIQAGMLREELIKTVDEIRSCFYQAFSSRCQDKIQLILFKRNKLIFVSEKSFKFPPFEDIRAAAEEALLGQIAPTVKSPRDPGPVLETLPTQSSPIVDEVSKMMRLLDDRLQKLESLEQRLKKLLSCHSAGRPRVICYYCHWEGHGTARCDALRKDKEGRLVHQKGQNYFLPSGALIPFDPSRPINSVVALFQASRSPASPADAPYRSSCVAIPMPHILESQTHLCRPIRKSSQSEVSLSDSVSLPRCTPSAQAVDPVLKKISEMLGPGLSASKIAKKNSSTAASAAVAPSAAVPGK
ncbi:hypothetical protein PTTG_30423, partial [Puccinia triticina 1-1 BBBD Race 1]